MNLTQNSIDRITIYFKDGRRIEFTDIHEATLEQERCWGEDGSYSTSNYHINLKNANRIFHIKRMSKRYVKNRKYKFKEK